MRRAEPCRAETCQAEIGHAKSSQARFLSLDEKRKNKNAKKRVQIMISWDIETEPLPIDELDVMMPEFNPEAVKLGNLKDPEKIKAKIESSKDLQRKNFFDRAALSATTGRVIAIGYYDTEKPKAIIHGVDVGDISVSDNVLSLSSESIVITKFWQTADLSRGHLTSMVGLNIFDFDLPFLIRRSWIMDIGIPPWIITRDRYFDSTFVDLRRKWLCGQNPQQTSSSFIELGRAFGSGGKDVEGVTGADFYKMYRGSKNERAKAIEYLINDIKQPIEWAYAMGIL